MAILDLVYTSSKPLPRWRNIVACAFINLRAGQSWENAFANAVRVADIIEQVRSEPQRLPSAPQTRSEMISEGHRLQERADSMFRRAGLVHKPRRSYTARKPTRKAIAADFGIIDDE